MIKSYIFASMYTVIGMTSWGAYSTISTEDTSVTAIQKIAVEAISSNSQRSLPKTLHRWRDHNGNWQYGEINVTDVDMRKYEKELALLRSLPRDVLPTQALKTAVKENSFLSLIPSIDEVLAMVKMAGSAEQQPDNQTTPLKKNE